MAAHRGAILLAFAAVASFYPVAAFVHLSPARSGQALALLAARHNPVLPSASMSRPSSLSALLRSGATQSLPFGQQRAGSLSSIIMHSTESGGGNLVGEDAASFDLKEQSLKNWGIFTLLLVTVLGALFVAWINPATGLGDEYIQYLNEIVPGHSSEAVIAVLLTIFGVAHSGLASLRPWAEEVIGARAWRVIFALVSLPLASSAIIYFINHRYDGAQLWDLKLVPGAHEFVWIISFISFLFLYPSTFNLLEIAAVEKPKLHMWATGIMRITRHPQMVGQGLWCAAHTLWMGNSFVLVASAFLMAHHLFGVWNGDRRLRDKYGDEVMEAFEEQTSVMPFAAIFQGRQVLPADYWKEFARLPYVIITLGTIGAYLAHPFMQAGSWTLHW
ncbi:15-cis-zeta-carotene chloroplastic-like [Nannochloropsis oceanica]